MKVNLLFIFTLLFILINPTVTTAQNTSLESDIRAELGLSLGHSYSNFSFDGGLRTANTRVDGFDPSNDVFLEFSSTFPMKNNLLFLLNLSILRTEYSIEDNEINSVSEPFTNRNTLLTLGIGYNFILTEKFFLRPSLGVTFQAATTFNGSGRFTRTNRDGARRVVDFFEVPGMTATHLNFSLGSAYQISEKAKLTFRVSYIRGGQFNASNATINAITERKLEYRQQFITTNVGIVFDINRKLKGRGRPKFEYPEDE